MRTKRNKTGFTLAEMMAAIAIMAILAGILIPAAKTLISSFENTQLVSEVIGAALSNARALAMNEGKYAGIRFQQDPKDRQYMILIISDEANLGSYGFRAVQGRKPMKLPMSVGVMDRIVKNQSEDGSTEYQIISNVMIDERRELVDTTSFSVVFAPSGKIATRQVEINNRDNKYDDLTDSSDDYDSLDDIFNSRNSVASGVGKFEQDGYLEALGLGKEDSRKRFYIYDKNRLRSISSNSRWTRYLKDLKAVHVNPYSGQITN